MGREKQENSKQIKQNKKEGEGGGWGAQETNLIFRKHFYH